MKLSEKVVSINLKTLLLNKNKNIIYIGRNSEEIEIKDLSIAISVDSFGATFQKYGEREYVENFSSVYNKAFPSSKESFLVNSSLSKFLSKNEDKIYLVEYILNHTLSSKVKDLSIAIKDNDFERAKKIFNSMKH